MKAHSTGKAISDVAPKQVLEDRLNALINKHNIMVFMKGTREAPRCGFSKTLIGILNGIGYVFNNHCLLRTFFIQLVLKLSAISQLIILILWVLSSCNL